jgi:hypothetical protein
VARQLACVDGWDAVARDPASGLILSRESGLPCVGWLCPGFRERNSFLGIGEGQDGKKPADIFEIVVTGRVFTAL